MAAELGETLDLADETVKNDLAIYKSLIAQGEGAKIF
jgi:hypothetical protein